jgi:hypothetical protein
MEFSLKTDGLGAPRVVFFSRRDVREDCRGRSVLDHNDTTNAALAASIRPHFLFHVLFGVLFGR